MSFDVLTTKSNDKSILSTTFLFEVSKSKLSDTKTVGDGRVVGYFRLTQNIFILLQHEEDFSYLFFNSRYSCLN